MKNGLGNSDVYLREYREHGVYLEIVSGSGFLYEIHKKNNQDH